MSNLKGRVSVDTAKALKRTGFDWKVDKWYEILADGQVMYSEGFENNWNNPVYGDSTISMPTLDVALKWLNETQNKNVVIIPFHSEETKKRGWEQGYVAEFYDMNENEYSNDPNWDGFDGWSDAFHTYEEALDFGIYSSLED